MADSEKVPTHDSSKRTYTRDQEIKTLEAVERITRSGTLGAGERMPTMLRYLVREELNGRGDRIKSFSIATEVLGRGQGFDPQSDSIARAEMTRLRKAIAHYNAAAGATDAVQITIPKGSYRPLITSATPLIAEALPKAVLPTRLRRMIAAFDLWSAGVGAAAFLALCASVYVAWALTKPPARKTAHTLAPMLIIQPAAQDGPAESARTLQALQFEVSHDFAHLPWLTVIQPTRLGDIEVHLAEASKKRAVYILEIRLRKLDEGYIVTTFLKRWPDQSVRWSASHEHRYLSEHLDGVLRDVAARITSDIGDPGGAITRAEITRLEGDGRHENRFVCLMNVRLYWHSYEPALRAEAEACLSATVRVDPDFEAGHAALAVLLIESAKLEGGQKRAQLLDDARAQLARVSSPSVGSDDARLAFAACMGDVKLAQQASARLVAAYPNNPDILADVGSKTGLFLGDWSAALAMEARAMALNPSPDPWYPLATLAKALLDGHPIKAIQILSKVPQRNFLIGQITRLAAAGLAGDRVMISDARLQLANLGIGQKQAMLDTIEGECWSDDVKQVFVRGVEMAMR
ncbi:MAG: hypothetical protein ACRCUE_12775 [Bosea sp. (in: a-proteobacteria)]